MKVLYDLPWAEFVEVSPNELALDQKHPSRVPPEGRDTVKWRFGSWAGMFGWLSGDRLTGDERNPTRREKVGIKLGEGPGDCGVLEIHLMKPNATEDKDMVRVVTLRPDGIEFHVPVKGLVVDTPAVTQFASDDQRYLYNVQGDATPDYPHGRIVQYRRQPDVALTPVAILKPEPLP